MIDKDLLFEYLLNGHTIKDASKQYGIDYDKLKRFCRKNKFERPKKNVEKRFCRNCNKELTRSQQISFCGLSCATTYNNLHKQDRYIKTRKADKYTKTRICKRCHTNFTKSRQSSVCEECHNKNKILINGSTLGDLKNLRNYQKASRIREHARAVYKASGKPRVCLNCGYSKHIEICHIVSISSFDDSRFIYEINDIKNLIPLCPNCHWEFDNGLLSIKDI